MNERTEILIQLDCRNLPGAARAEWQAVRLGVQQGRAVVDDVAGDVPQVTFTIPLRVTGQPATDLPDFGGPFVHGARRERFVYLCWGTRRDGTWETIQRAKVHLRQLDWPSIQRAVEHGLPIQAMLDMTDARGGPLSGSVKDHNIEWHL